MSTTRPQRADSSRKVGGDAAVIAVGYLASFAYPLVSLPFLARALGAEGLGTVMVLLAVLQLVVMTTDFGFGMSALRRTVHAPDRAARSVVVAETLGAKAVLWGACAIVLAVPAATVPLLREHAGALVLGMVLVLLGTWYPGWLLQGLGRTVTFALAMALSRLAALVGLVLTVDGPDHIGRAVGWQLAPMALSALAVWPLLLWRWRQVHPATATPAGIRAALRDSAPLFVPNIAVMVSGSATTLALGALTTPTQVAFFGAAERFANAVRGVGRGVVDAMLPRITRPDTDHRLRRMILGGIPLAYLLSAAALIIGAGPVLPWYLGAEMADAVPVVQLYALLLIPAGLTAALSLRATAQHRYRTVAHYTAIAAIAHLALVVPAVLIGEARGAALSLVACEVLLAALFCRDAARRRGAPQ
ncbi:MAG: lipopolysaccharide biosynthesis protein [Brachybacterium sp.]|nr:lipopolysaccharide biosynthesis protein [Brachybacterium sp.]